jgi:molecular chaperone GrpE
LKKGQEKNGAKPAAHDPASPAETAPKPQQAAQPDRKQPPLTDEEIVSLRKKAAERDEFLAQLQRVQADFSNFQKRMDKERESWTKYAAEKVAKTLLPLMDNFTITITKSCGCCDAKVLAGALENLNRQLLASLQAEGLTELSPKIGEKFDPWVHQAVATTETSDVPEQCVAECLSKGYRLHDRLLRPAMVKVAIKPQAKEPGIPGDTAGGDVNGTK